MFCLRNEGFNHGIEKFSKKQFKVLLRSKALAKER
jgi:hypothetical protein